MSQLRQLLADTVTFHRRHSTITKMVWLLSCLVACLLNPPDRLLDMPAFVGIAIFMAMLPVCLLSRYEKALEARIATIDGGPVWQVQINGVNVGEMKDADYAAIRRMVFFDGGVYLVQVINLWAGALRMVYYLFKITPLGALWIAIGCFFLAPDTFAEALAVIQHGMPPQTESAIPMLAKCLVMVSILILGANVAAGHYFGFVNEFDLGCDIRVRRAMARAANGEVSLSRIENGFCITPDEVACIWVKG